MTFKFYFPSAKQIRNESDRLNQSMHECKMQKDKILRHHAADFETVFECLIQLQKKRYRGKRL